MRYRFIDGVLSLDAGDRPRIEVVKTFEPSSDGLSGPAGPRRVPSSLILELLAMTGGHLIFRHLGGSRLPLLIKVPDVQFEAAAGAGERLHARAELLGISAAGDEAVVAETRGEVRGEAGRIAHGRLLFLCVSVPGVDLRAYGALA